MLLGLDLASRLTGWCCGSGPDVPACGAWEFPRIDGNYGLLLTALEDYLNAAHARFGFTSVAYESPILITGRRSTTEGFQERGFADTLAKLRLLYPLGAFVEYWCARHGVEVFEVTVSAIKSEVAGHRHAEKDALVAVAQACGLKLPPPSTGADDAADAFGAWLILLRATDPKAAAEWQSKIVAARGGLL